MSLSPRFGAEFFVTFCLVLGGCGSAVRAAFSREGLFMPTPTKTVFLGILSLVGLLALPPLAAANDTNWQQHEDREHRAKEELSTRDRHNFEAYLDAHWETAQLLYQQPELINDRQFLHNHRALRDWLADHTEAARVIQANPRQVLWEQRTAQRRTARSGSPAELSTRDRHNFEAHLDAHSETAQLLYQQPELINDRQFLRDHRALRDWLADHIEAARVIQANPRQVLWEQRTAQRRTARTISPTISPEDVRSLDGYLDTHWQEANALYRDPELINDSQFVQAHSSLDDWLQARPDAAQAISERPRYFFWRQRTVTPQDFLHQLFNQ